MIVFADTYALIAWLNPRDNAHAAVREFLASYGGRLVTTEWVLMEVADALSAPHARKLAIEFLQSIRSDPNYEVIGYDADTYGEGFECFASHHDKGWSLTDCISFGVMRKRQLNQALTGDRHFTQAGFHAVFEAGKK